MLGAFYFEGWGVHKDNTKVSPPACVPSAWPPCAGLCKSGWVRVMCARAVLQAVGFMQQAAQLGSARAQANLG